MLSHGPPILFSPYLNGNDTNNSNNNEKQWDSPGARLAHFALPSRAIGVRVILTPSSTWQKLSEYEDTADDLAQRFASNFERFVDTVPQSVVESGIRPRV